MSTLLSSHITADAELDPDLVCDVYRAPSANTAQDREVCEGVILRGTERWSHVKPNQTKT